MRIVARVEWGARPPKSVRHISTPTSEVWLHHTATGQHGADGVRAIQRYHMDSKGWQDIAYSFLVDSDGTVYEGRGAGVAGAHTQGHNTVSHAICAMGNYQTGRPTDALLNSIAELVRHGHTQGWWPERLTGGHRDVGTTSCPGQHLYARIDDLDRPARRYQMVVYAKRGTPDTLSALAAHAAVPKGVVTSDLAEAQAAFDRGENVVAVGGPASRDLPGARAVVGVNAAETGQKVFALARNGWA